MERSTENLGKYASFVAERCRESGLRPFHKSGVASVIDYSSRLVELSRAARRCTTAAEESCTTGTMRKD